MKFHQTITLVGLLALVMTALSPVVVYGVSGSLHVNQQSNTGVLPAIIPPTNTGVSIGTKPFSPSPPVNIVVTDKTAVLNWSSSELVLVKLAWGLTTEYDLGSIATEQFEKSHSILINGLEPNTKYYFRIISISVAGAVSNLEGSFTTSSEADRGAPENVTQFLASSQLDRILLSWNNPDDYDFSSVRVVRSDKFYPLDPLNGKVIYEGRANKFVDADVTPGVIYYYTAFSLDYSGNYSSGALASAMIVWFSENIVDLQLPYDADFVVVPGLFNNFIIKDRYGNVISNNNIVIPSGENLKIEVPESVLPQKGSFLTLTVKDEKRQTGESTYLFTHDKAEDEFYVNTPTFKNEQVYNLVITVFNSSKLIIGKVFGTVKVVQASEFSSASLGRGGNAGTPWPLRHLPEVAAIVVVGGASLVVSIRYLRYFKIARRIIDKK